MSLSISSIKQISFMSIMLHLSSNKKHLVTHACFVSLTILSKSLIYSPTYAFQKYLRRAVLEPPLQVYLPNTLPNTNILIKNIQTTSAHKTNSHLFITTLFCPLIKFFNDIYNPENMQSMTP